MTHFPTHYLFRQDLTNAVPLIDATIQTLLHGQEYVFQSSHWKCFNIRAT